MAKSIYLYHIAASTLLFIFVIVSAIITSQAYGDTALNDALRVNGINGNQSWDSLSNEQQLSMIAASSLHTIPPNSEMQTLQAIIFGIIFGIVILYVILHYLGAFITRLFFTLSIGMIISMFFTSIGYLTYGANIFNITYLSIIFGLSIILTLIWLVYPEWWIVTTMALLIAASGAAFLGSSFAPIPIICLLIILSIYDYIAVIRTKFMVNFAKKVMSVQLPAAISLPYNRNVSLITQGVNFEPVEERTDRGFMILGTGDLLFPTMLATSVSFYNSMVNGFIIGIFIIISYIIMMYVMYFSKHSQKIQALPGLPFLCTGAIIGYIITLAI
jgi:presenilin-like A22 family membrane protease